MRHLLILKYIDKIARTGSRRSAAEELGITASALNRWILGIEAELSLLDNSNDIAIVFEPILLKELQSVCAVPQPIYCVMSGPPADQAQKPEDL